MQVSKWGNSLAVRLPTSVIDVLGLKEGDDIEIHVAGRRVFEIKKTPSAQEVLARLRKFRGALPADFKFDRLLANERKA
jgi:antitoxin MazE